MNNKYDWRISYIRKVINSLSDVLKEVYQQPIDEIGARLEKESLIENIIGMAFLTSQIYISGTIADAKFFSKEPNKMTKPLLLHNFSDSIPGTNVTALEICDAYANYYKHHEEWTAYSKDKINKHTIETLAAVGIDVIGNINIMTEVPFSRIIDLLLTTDDGIEFSSLVTLLSDWRSRIFASIIPS